MSSESGDRARSAVRTLWERRRPDILRRADALVVLVGSIRDGGEAVRDEAERDAHRLAGTLAAFGLSAAARIARELEQELAARRSPAHTSRTRTTRLARDLRRQLNGLHPEAAGPGRVPEATSPFLLLVCDDTGVSEAVQQAASARGRRVHVAADLQAADQILADHTPDAVLLHPVAAWPSVLAFTEGLSARNPPIPTLVMTSATAYTDRLEAVRAGARAVFPPGVSPAEVVGLVESILERERQGSETLLVVDDDPAFLSVIEHILAAEGLRVTTLADSRRFWQTLEEVRPDLVLLDVVMPHTSGTELCRVLRADPRWAGLPVIVLTGRNEPGSVQEAFAVGADDYVVKDQVRTELLTRIANRLQRVHLYRDLADRDPLTGLANRRKFSEEVTRLLRLAERHQQPLSFVMLDLDRFKQVNDRYGHAVGDEVLHRLAQVLLAQLRDEDIVGRWGGEEFALVLFGLHKADGVQRLTDVLELFRQETFVAPDGRRFNLTFSAGVAQLPDDGTDARELYQAADQALFMAKSAGRNRILPAGARIGQQSA